MTKPISGAGKNKLCLFAAPQHLVLSLCVCFTAAEQIPYTQE